MKVKIVAIGKEDDFYNTHFHSELVGSTGEFESLQTCKDGFRSGNYKIDPECKNFLSGRMITFYRVKVHKL